MVATRRSHLYEQGPACDSHPMSHVCVATLRPWHEGRYLDFIGDIPILFGYQKCFFGKYKEEGFKCLI